jgi:hypothetical protein
MKRNIDVITKRQTTLTKSVLKYSSDTSAFRKMGMGRPEAAQIKICVDIWR